MVTGKELVTKCVDQTIPLSVHGNNLRMAGHKVGFPAQITATLCGVIESRVPFGYEDEAGFHYGASSADWFFTI
jgi:hypothetical protein